MGSDKRSGLVQGTLDMLVLKTLEVEEAHAYGLNVRLTETSAGVFRVNAGSLFPAIRRLERDGLIKGEWRVTDAQPPRQVVRADVARPGAVEAQHDGMAGADGGHLAHPPCVAGRPIVTWIRRAVDAVRRLLLRRRVERDLDEELAAYLDAAITRGMTGGLDRTAAERAARVEMGSTEAIKESVRAVGWESLVDGVVQDLRYAWRRLRAAPVFSLVAVLMLALGIGANTAIFSLVNGLLLRAVPGATIDRLAVVTETDRGVANIFRGTTSDERRALETTPASPFDGVFTSDVLLGALTGNGHVELVTGETVSGTYFSALGVTPAAGRLLVSADDHDSEGAPIVISDRLWQRWFSGSPTAIGTVVHMAGYPLTVVGIAPSALSRHVVARRFLPWISGSPARSPTT